MLRNLDKIIQDGVDRGILQKATSDAQLNSAEICIDGTKYVNFGSCSYLGLEFHSALKEAVKSTVDKFGTQFSTSRTYLSLGLYDLLEAELSSMFHKPVLVLSSTTLGHLAALPVIIEAGDVVIVDLQVHASIQMTTKILKANKVAIHLIPHNDMESLESKIKALSDKANRIWYMADGVYSMYGDFAPLDKIQSLLNKYEKLFLYIDDAHGMGWTGNNGTGYVRSQMEHHDKMVLVTSLNKSFAASGGVLVFPEQEMWRKVKNCGATMIFSGPIQPPMLGAAIASAKLHQSEEIVQLQNDLKQKIEFTNRRLRELELPQYLETDAPLFFIPVGLPRVILTIIKRMKKKGFFLNSAGFPATPIKKGGLRFMITNNLSIEQIDEMLTTLRNEYIKGLLSEGSSPEYVAKQFKLDPFLLNHRIKLPKKEALLNLDEAICSSISEIDPDEWNSLFSRFGSNEHRNLMELEKVFIGNDLLENNWDINYHIIRDNEGNIVLASVYSLALMMDDLFAEKDISGKIKEIRKENRLYLTSKTLLTGTPFTKGKSVFIDYNHNSWKDAVRMHVKLLQEIAENKEASKIIIREFSSSEKKSLEGLMFELGMLELQLPNNCVLHDMSWEGTDGLLARLSQKYRYSLRREVLKKEHQFEVSFERPVSKKVKQHIYHLYKTVHDRSTEISVFQLPYALFEKMYKDPSYDFIQLYLKGGPDYPIAVMLSQVIDSVYNAQLVGLDYGYVRENGTYKQILYQTVNRAKKLGCIKVDLAYTAEMEKKKVGAVPESTFGFIMALEHNSYAEMDLLQ